MSTMSKSTVWPASAKSNDIAFPSFSDAEVDDLHENVSEEEKKYYKKKFEDLNAVVKYRLHCTSCDRHLGDSITNEHQIKCHPMLLTLICRPCYNFYNSGEFHQGEDGSELYCRWCGQGGQVYCCSECIHVFCAKCIKRNMGICKIREIEFIDDWKCFKCAPRCLWDARALCWALLKYFALRIKFISEIKDLKLKDEYNKMSSEDHTECCKDKRRKRKKETGSSNSKELLTIQDKNNTPINKNESNKTRRQKRTLSPKESSPDVTSQKSRRVTEPVIKLLSTRGKDPDSDDNTKSKTQMRIPSILRNSTRKRETGNIIQLTDNDVSINKLTGGLKFRIDPQNLSPKELYRLPDGRIFSIKRNQNLPGGYSASIVSLGNNTNEVQKGKAIRDKPMLLLSVNPPPLVKASKKCSTKEQEKKSMTYSDLRKCDLEVPIEWFRYNLVDAISSLEETLARLKHLNKQTKSSFYLRSRSISEMRDLQKSFDGALNGTALKCKKVHEKLIEGFQFYLRKKTDQILDSDDDDAVEILPNKDSTIFIDENSTDSVKDIAKELHVNGTEEIVTSDVLDGSHFDIEDENNPINTLSPNKDDIDVSTTVVSNFNKPDNVDGDVNGEEVERENVLVSNEISGDDPVPNASISTFAEDTVNSKTPANLDTKDAELLNTKDDKKGDLTVDSATVVDTGDDMIDDLLNDNNITESRIITDSIDNDF